MNDVLVLNKCMMPVNIISWQEAICLWYTNKAIIIESYEDKWLHSWENAMNMPAVIRLCEFVKPDRKVDFYQPFTRENVWIRDHGKCQYCGNPISRNKFTFDHVIPKSRGGMTNWRNIVCSCLPCNNKKGNRTPTEAGMKVIQNPFAPLIASGYHEGIIKRIQKMGKVFNNKKWRDYIYWQVTLESD